MIIVNAIKSESGSGVPTSTLKWFDVSLWAIPKALVNEILKKKQKKSKNFQKICNNSKFSKQSLEELGPIILMLKEVKGDAISDVPIMLVGNKKDEEQVRKFIIKTIALYCPSYKN